MKKVFAIAAIGLAAGLAQGQIDHGYSEDFESLVLGDPAALGNAGWKVGANVWGDAARTAFIYNYFTFPAPNGGAAFSALTTGEGGPPQGLQQLVAYSDYNNGDHGNGLYIEANLFQEWFVDASADVGDWTFEFDAKKGDVDPSVEVIGFIKVLDPNNSYALTRFETIDLQAAASSEWGTFSLTTSITNDLDGQIFQIGWFNTSTGYVNTGMIYDNVNLTFVPAPAGVGLLGLGGLVATRRRRG